MPGDDSGSDTAVARAVYISPVADPLLSGKALKRSLKLIQTAATSERDQRASQKAKSGDKNDKNDVKVKKTSKSSTRPSKILHRGVHEVTKCIRKGNKGCVFFASDVFPLEILAHLPVLCEEQDIPYAYVCPKKSLGHAFKSKRPASVLMVTTPAEEDEAVHEIYGKVEKLLRKNHPYL